MVDFSKKLKRNMPELNDAQKLHAFATEVKKMRDAQAKYFAFSKLSRKGEVLPNDLRDALDASKGAEKRVDQLAAKILSPQAELKL